MAQRTTLPYRASPAHLIAAHHIVIGKSLAKDNEQGTKKLSNNSQKFATIIITCNNDNSKLQQLIASIITTFFLPLSTGDFTFNFNSIKIKVCINFCLKKSLNYYFILRSTANCNYFIMATVHYYCLLLCLFE